MTVRTTLSTAACALALCWIAGDSLLPMELGALHLAPFLALLALLWRRRYPGEAYIGRLRNALRTRRLRPRKALRVSKRSPEVAPPRGGRLIGHALAVRPPPAAPAVPIH